ncbi:hypothetical protein AVEN_54385-1 [Araneus ventricosus]|uniref:Uncharacterized protein n=1 Tax=Araneus ventricosus TaxID=182803 RepID=A0A4Y2FVJ8_ARAVE|nr:hypothetical protein AVEN_54385-1 [Araneus ventricosus]
MSSATEASQEGRIRTISFARHQLKIKQPSRSAAFLWFEGREGLQTRSCQTAGRPSTRDKALERLISPKYTGQIDSFFYIRPPCRKESEIRPCFSSFHLL